MRGRLVATRDLVGVGGRSIARADLKKNEEDLLRKELKSEHFSVRLDSSKGYLKVQSFIEIGTNLQYCRVKLKINTQLKNNIQLLRPQLSWPLAPPVRPSAQQAGNTRAPGRSRACCYGLRRWASVFRA